MTTNDEVDDEVYEEEDFKDHFDSRATLGFALGLGVGVFLGAVTGLLLAPQRGRVTRRNIKRKFRDLQDETVDHIGDWRDEARKELDRQKRKLGRRIKKKR